jgi:hypothetical protein
MKIALLLLLVGIALCQVTTVESWRGLGWGARGIGWGGWGWGGPWRWGGLGWGGPWGGLGWGRWGGFGWGGRFGGFGRRWGRDVSSVSGEHLIPTFSHNNKTHCAFTTRNNTVNCHGATFNFNCKVIPRFVGLTAESYRVHNLSVVPATVDHVYNLFSRGPNHKLNSNTLVEKSNEVTFSVYRSEKIRDNGIQFVDDVCWRSFETMVQTTLPHHVKFALFITNTV